MSLHLNFTEPPDAIPFKTASENEVRQFSTSPETWGVVEEAVRCHLRKRFPFGIYYTIEDDYILIIAVMHMSRNPGYWKSRLKN